MCGSFVLILMAIFDKAIAWIAAKLGFMATVNFVYLIVIAFLLAQVFIDNLRLAELNEKAKNLDRYIALENNKKDREN